MAERVPRKNWTRPGSARWIVAAVGMLMSLVVPATASAHTGFESSTPSTGSTIEQPIDLVTITFTGESAPVGDKFIALTPEGVLQQAASIETVDNKVFSIRFDPPLAGGQVGIRWNVQAADAHPIEGAFAFTVNAGAQAASSGTDAANGTPTGQSLDEFLATDDSGGIGQLLGFIGVAGALGALVGAAYVLRRRRREVEEAVAASQLRRSEQGEAVNHP